MRVVWAPHRTKTVVGYFRRSTGGTFQSNIVQDTVCMSTDDKLVSLCEIMTIYRALYSSVSELKEDIDCLQAQNTVTEKRLKLLEYKSIDQKARNRRNNLIFSGVPRSNA